MLTLALMAEPHRGTDSGPYTPATGHAAVSANPQQAAHGAAGSGGPGTPSVVARHAGGSGGYVGHSSHAGNSGYAVSGGSSRHSAVTQEKATGGPGAYVASALPPSWSAGRAAPDQAGGSAAPAGYGNGAHTQSAQSSSRHAAGSAGYSAAGQGGGRRAGGAHSGRALGSSAYSGPSGNVFSADGAPRSDSAQHASAGYSNGSAGYGNGSAGYGNAGLSAYGAAQTGTAGHNALGDESAWPGSPSHVSNYGNATTSSEGVGYPGSPGAGAASGIPYGGGSPGPVGSPADVAAAGGGIGSGVTAAMPSRNVGAPTYGTAAGAVQQGPSGDAGLSASAGAGASSRYFTPSGGPGAPISASGPGQAGHPSGGQPQPFQGAGGGQPPFQGASARFGAAGDDAATRPTPAPSAAAGGGAASGLAARMGAATPQDVVTLEALSAAADRGAAQRAKVSLGGVAQTVPGGLGAGQGAGSQGGSGQGPTTGGRNRAGVSQLPTTPLESSESRGQGAAGVGRGSADVVAADARNGKKKRPMSGVALAGFITAFVAAPVGLVLSLCGLGLTSKGHVRGRALAIWGTMISLILSSAFVYAGLQAYKMGNQFMMLRDTISGRLPGMASGLGGGSAVGGVVPEDIPEPGAAVRADADQAEFLGAIRSQESVELTEFGSADLVGAGIAICMAEVAGRDPLVVLPDMLNVTESAAQVVYYAAIDHLCVR